MLRMNVLVFCFKQHTTCLQASVQLRNTTDVVSVMFTRNRLLERHYWKVQKAS